MGSGAGFGDHLPGTRAAFVFSLCTGRRVQLCRSLATGGNCLRARPRYFQRMCGRAHLSSDVSEIKLVFSIPPERPTPKFAATWNVAPTDPLPIVGLF
jgi:hypothetical protein